MKSKWLQTTVLKQVGADKILSLSSISFSLPLQASLFYLYHSSDLFTWYLTYHPDVRVSYYKGPDGQTIPSKGGQQSKFIGCKSYNDIHQESVLCRLYFLHSESIHTKESFRSHSLLSRAKSSGRLVMRFNLKIACEWG